MASAYIRIKVELPQDEAERFVRAARAAADMHVTARDIVGEVTAEVMAVLRRSRLRREYHADIRQAPR